MYFVILLSIVSSSAYKNIPVTRWIDPEGRNPITYKEWKSHYNLPSRFSIGNVYSSSRKGGGLIDIIVNSTLYDSISSELKMYVHYLENARYSVNIDTLSGGTPESLRVYLYSLYTGKNLKGVMLVGDLPIAWFQMMNIWAPGWYEEFPCDLYYMDLDGVWEDTLIYDSGNDTLIPGTDSIYDTHYGNMAPEIWVGRLMASTLTWDNEITLLRRYFVKDFQFRKGGFSITRRALNFVDDDWANYPELSHPGLDSIYDSVKVVVDSNTTCADTYKVELKNNYEWVGIFCHSSPAGHRFKIPPDTWDGWVYNSDIRNIQPYSVFYNLFACSNARYVESNYMGGWYVFADSFGLGAVGTCKTGSMLEFEDFYHPLGRRWTLGEAFKHWFAIWGEAWGDESRSWFYGMTLLGDATLIVNHPPPSQPVILSVASLDTTVRLIWQKNPEPEIGRYYIMRGTQSGIYTDTLNYVASPDTECIDYNVSHTHYYYTLTAMDTFGFESINADEVDIVAMPYHDVAISSITTPKDTVYADSTIIPSATVVNYTDSTENFSIVCEIDTGIPVYTDTLNLDSLVGYDTTTVSFNVWNVPSIDSQAYKIRIYTNLSADENPQNDTFTQWFYAVKYNSIPEFASQQTNKIELKASPSIFSKNVKISFEIPDDGYLELIIYDITGRIVRILANGMRGKGRYETFWNGKNKFGNYLSKGIYFINLKYKEKSEVSKIILIR